MHDLVIRIKKKNDGSAALSCRRPDGTTTWQRQEGVQGAFFPMHDLTHYAVETVLGHRQGFFGLLADGWDLTDFGPPWRRGAMPQEAGVSEFIVGVLDRERGAALEWTAAEFNAAADIYFARQGVASQWRLSDADLGRIRARRAELFQQWKSLAPGDTLELEFTRPRTQAVGS